MIVTIAEQFTGNPSDREQSPTIIWKPGFTDGDHLLTREGPEKQEAFIPKP